MKSLKSINLSLSISPVMRWVITILILVVALAVVVVFYVQKQTKNNNLKDDLATARTTLVNNSVQKDLLQTRLTTATGQLSLLKAQFTSPNESASLEEALYKAAADGGVELDRISCSAPKDEEVGDITYKVYKVSADIHGDEQSILRFTTILGQWLPSAGVSSTGMSGSDEGGMSATVTLNVYAL